jgi:hypothetical protein
MCITQILRLQQGHARVDAARSVGTPDSFAEPAHGMRDDADSSSVIIG